MDMVPGSAIQALMYSNLYGSRAESDYPYVAKMQSCRASGIHPIFQPGWARVLLKG